MYATQSILNFSLSLGQLRGVRVHLSLLMFVVMGALVWRFGDHPSLGLLASAILLLSVIIHQLAQLFVARATGNELSDIVLWPLGGLTTQAQYASFPAQVQVQVVGPVVNLAVALICMFQLKSIGVDVELLNPLTAFDPDKIAATTPAVRTGLMIYCSNVLLLCVNLLPVAPFDGGRLLRAFLAERYDTVEVSDVMLRLGLVFSLFGLIGAFIFDQSAIVALSSFVLIVHLHEIGLRSSHTNYFQTDSGDDFHDDFGELDPELEDIESYRNNSEDADTDELIARSSMMARRMARKESERQRREAIQREKEEQQVDAILERIHRDGKESLKPAELQLLRSVSKRYRKHSSDRREPNTETGR